MTNRTIVVAGGGHAGIHAVRAIKKRMKKMSCRIVLLDPKPSHIRKVVLFKAVTGGCDLTVPWSAVLPEGTDFIRGAIRRVHPTKNIIEYVDDRGITVELPYDVLVIAIGSVARVIEGARHPLSDLTGAQKIKEQIEENVRLACTALKATERKKLLSVGVIGGGISGIETAFELNQYMREKVKSCGLDPAEVQVHLIHSQHDLLQEGTEKVRKRLRDACSRKGIHVQNGVRALQEESGVLHLSNGVKIPLGLAVWSIGLLPSPAVKSLGLPEEAGRLLTDPSYRVQRFSNIYSIGDCAKIIDPVSGQADGMTCKEGINQAGILGKIIASDLKGKRAPRHRPIRKTLCFSLGPGDALVWVKVLGVEIIIEKIVAWHIRKMTWNMASMMK